MNSQAVEKETTMSTIESDEQNTGETQEPAKEQPLLTFPERSTLSANTLQQDVQEFQRINKSLLSKLEALEERTRESERLVDDLRKQCNASEQRASEMEQRIQELHARVATHRQQLEELAARKVSDPVGDQTRMSQEQRLSQELDNMRKQRDDALANSIAARLQLGKEHAVASPSKESVTGAALARPTKLRMTTTNVMKLDVIPAGAKTPTNNIPYNQPFNVAIGVDTKALGLEQEAAIGCTVQLDAKPVEGGSALYVGQYTGTISKEGTFTMHASARTLPHGFYHLQARLTVRERKAGEQPLNVVEEHSAINVY